MGDSYVGKEGALAASLLYQIQAEAGILVVIAFQGEGWYYG